MVTLTEQEDLVMMEFTFFDQDAEKIANKLSLSVATVEAVLRNIYGKFGVREQLEAMRAYLDYKRDEVDPELRELGEALNKAVRQSHAELARVRPPKRKRTKKL